MDTDKKKIGLTLRMPLLSWSRFDFDSIRIGTILDSIQVIRVDPGVGVLASLPNISTPAYIHVYHFNFFFVFNYIGNLDFASFR